MNRKVWRDYSCSQHSRTHGRSQVHRSRYLARNGTVQLNRLWNFHLGRRRIEKEVQPGVIGIQRNIKRDQSHPIQKVKRAPITNPRARGIR
jgi:hypothetical protein